MYSMSLISLHKCPLLAEALQFSELVITWNLLWSIFIIYIFTNLFDVACYTVCIWIWFGCFKYLKNNQYHRVVWGGDNFKHNMWSCHNLVALRSMALPDIWSRLASLIRIEGSSVRPHNLPLSTSGSGTHFKMPAGIPLKGSAKGILWVCL